MHKGFKNKRNLSCRDWEKTAERHNLDISLGDALSRLFLALGLEAQLTEQKAVFIWKDTVGAQIASISEALTIKNGILKVSVQNQAWRNELSYLEAEIRSKLNAVIGSNVVKRIKFS
ncbi:MAG: DUF721 domain-containing protein [Calditrichaeota bacterium]|nr:DUF721 domain-containing protein [Calditrichota bacterium]